MPKENRVQIRFPNKISTQPLRKLWLWLVFLLLLPSPLAAYLDPGTGSMLFSALVGLVSTLYFTLRSSAFLLRVKLAGLLAKTLHKKMLGNNAQSYSAKTRHSLVFFSEGKQYWNCFYPVLQELERRKINAAYWTMDAEDPCLEANFAHIEARFIGGGYAAFAQMNALRADICIMTTPGLDVLQIRRSKKVAHYSHIIHALDDCTTYRVFGTDYFDSMLLCGQHQVEALEGLEAVRNIAQKQKYIVGCSYLDVLQQKLQALRQKAQQKGAVPTQNKQAKKPFRLLVAPSWGPNGLLAKYGMELLLPLLESGYDLLIRPHPQSRISEPELLQELQEQLESTQQVAWDFERENLSAFLASDAMISDFSSVIYDYLILIEKPVLIAEFTFNYDGYDAMDLLPREPWTIRAGRELGIRFGAKDIGRLKELLEPYLTEGETKTRFRRKLADLRSYAYQYPGEAGVRAVDAILQIRESLET